MAPDEKKPPQGLDWARAYARLEHLARATQAAGALGPAEALALLDERARQLARPPAPAPPQGALLEVVRLEDGAQAYALEARFTHEVLRAPELTPLPGAPPLLRGLTLLRGEVLPVVELAPLFGRPPRGTRALVLVVGTGRPELGLCASAVHAVAPLARGALRPAPPCLREGREWVGGVEPEGLVFLEGGALLADERLVFDLCGERAS